MDTKKVQLSYTEVSYNVVCLDGEDVKKESIKKHFIGSKSKDYVEKKLRKEYSNEDVIIQVMKVESMKETIVIPIGVLLNFKYESNMGEEVIEEDEVEE